MIDIKEYTDDVATLLIKDIQQEIQRLTEEAVKSIQQQRVLSQKRRLLIESFDSISSAMTQLFIKDLIMGMDQEIAILDEKIHKCEAHKEYYNDILEVVRN
ncbi:hypothetical protein [Rummeliibacillus sp. BSL5]